MVGKEKDALTVKVKDIDGAHIVYVSGECDMSSASILKDALQALLFPSAGVPERVVIDLRGLRYMDSSAFWVLAAANRKVSKYGGQLTLVAGSEQPILKIIRMLKMDRMMGVYPTPEEALSHLAGVGKTGGPESTNRIC